MAKTPTPGQGATRTIKRAGQAPIWVVKQSTLSVLKGPDRGKQSNIERRTWRVGTAEDNDLVLNDSSVSAHHFELIFDEKGVLLRDLGSTNGTFVDGFRVGEIYLKGATKVDLGATQVRLSLLKTDIEIPLSESNSFGGLLGKSPGMRAVFVTLEKVSASETTVLICGESGTGKSLAARALHERSSRKDGPFVVVDCGAVAPNLIESHLFGHARGAFTGAVDDHVGAFEDADTGTIVLEEIGDLPLELQPKLLRAVEAKTIQRIGDGEPRAVDVRIVACTHHNVEELVDQGRFRKDLLFRLSVIMIHLPPLRQRREDIPMLAAHLLTQLSGDPMPDIEASVLELLMQHTWPGNVRELRNVMERMSVVPDMSPRFYLGTRSLGQSAVVDDRADLTVSIDQPLHVVKRTWTETLEREYLRSVLRECKGNISEVARVSGLARQTCYRLMEKHGLRR
ncbi:sigma 54-interacting transcriptional regulator, partial [Myxococcota bacterium]